MPPGGDGYYYFSAFFLVSSGYAIFDIEINGKVLCTVRGDVTDSTDEEAQAGCSATTYATEGLQSLNLAHSGVFPKWNRNSLNSVNLENLINH